jgi:hypothetical protein
VPKQSPLKKALQNTLRGVKVELPRRSIKTPRKAKNVHQTSKNYPIFFTELSCNTGQYLQHPKAPNPSQ